jgi:hypothetical protein
VAKNGVDRALTAASAIAALALAGAFVAGLLGGPDGRVDDAGDAPQTAPSTPEPSPDPTISPPAGDPIRPTTTTPPPLADPAAAFEGSAKVEVLNGAGRAGFARDATVRLRSLGHDVVAYGNANRFDYPSSVVLDRGGPPGSARAVADALGIAEVRAEAAPELALDATVILGSDWVLPPPPEEPARGLRGVLDKVFGPGEDG